MPSLDLGCGGNKRGDVGVDIAPWPGVNRVVNLGFEPLPFPDNEFDRAYCIHAIEHIPFVVNIPVFRDGTIIRNQIERWIRYYPMRFFLSEVFRVLRPSATFEVLTIAVWNGRNIDPRAWQDPTHVSVWTVDTIKHFIKGTRESTTGDANDTMAGLQTDFQLIHSQINSDLLLDIQLRKP